MKKIKNKYAIRKKRNIYIYAHTNTPLPMCVSVCVEALFYFVTSAPVKLKPTFGDGCLSFLEVVIPRFTEEQCINQLLCISHPSFLHSSYMSSHSHINKQ